MSFKTDAFAAAQFQRWTEEHHALYLCVASLLSSLWPR